MFRNLKNYICIWDTYPVKLPKTLQNLLKFKMVVLAVFRSVLPTNLNIVCQKSDLAFFTVKKPFRN